MGRRPRGLLGWAQGPVAARSIALGGGGLTSRPALLIRALADEPAGLLLAANTLFHGSHAQTCSCGVCDRGPDGACWSGREDGDGRYRLSPTSDGFLKLDSRSGAVSECKRGPDGYQCRLVPDEQAALQAEIDRLVKENAALREQLARVGPPPPERPGESARPEKAPVLPREDEVDRALGLMEKFLRRFMC